MREATESYDTELPRMIQHLPTLTGAELFDAYDEALNGGYSNPALMFLKVQYRTAIKLEILRRMK